MWSTFLLMTEYLDMKIIMRRMALELMVMEKTTTMSLLYAFRTPWPDLL
jgi:hypothetical protein